MAFFTPLPVLCFVQAAKQCCADPPAVVSQIDFILITARTDIMLNDGGFDR